MKTLEEAAHRMNTLLVKTVHPKISDDQDAKPSENSEELTSQEKATDDSATTADESGAEEDDKKEESGEDSDSLLGKHL